MKTIVGALSDSKVADTLWTDGLHVAGERYVVFKVEGRSIYGRKVSYTTFISLDSTANTVSREERVLSSSRPTSPFSSHTMERTLSQETLP